MTFPTIRLATRRVLFEVAPSLSLRMASTMPFTSVLPSLAWSTLELRMRDS